MSLQVTNSLSRKREPFEPLTPKEVKMYVCGPTVYGFTHVGNARPVVFFDVLKRFLRFSGYKVLHVSNYTDVDDKIINRAREEQTTSDAVSKKYTEAFIADTKALGIIPPDVTPRVTDHIPQIIKFIEGLVANGMAYVVGEEVFYSVRKFTEYGKLSGKNVDDLLSGARVETDEKKKDPLDFSLWKPRKAADEPAWDSPWGKGRPGWHIECSAMALTHLGETFDIHGGGIDLTHPHHENEIAQSEGLTKKLFCKYWLHVNLVTTNSEKMSKSIGNIFYNRDFIAKYSAETLKYLILSGHYRSPIDFSEKHIRDCQSALHRVYTTLSKVRGLVSQAPKNPNQPTTEENKVAEFGPTFKTQWVGAMEDDLNTARVTALVFDYVRMINAYVDRKGFVVTEKALKLLSDFLASMKELSDVLNLFGQDSVGFLQQMRSLVLKERNIDPMTIEDAIVKRKIARDGKDFSAADQIRKDLLAKGIELKDSTTGTTWDVVFLTNPS